MNSRLLPLLSVGSLIAVSAVHAQLLTENFNYTQGASLVAENAAWVAHGAGAGLVVVDSGAAVLQGGASREDVNRALGATYSTGTLTASFTLDLSSGTIGATGVNSYFLHFSDGGTSNFRGRVFIGSSILADADLFRIGIENDGNESALTVAYSSDLDRTAAHTVTFSYDLDSRTSKLWVDTATSNAPTAQDTVAPGTALPMNAIALRQGGTAGTTGNYAGLHVDNLVVNYTAVPEPHEYAAVAGAGLLAFAMWRRRK